MGGALNAFRLVAAGALALAALLAAPSLASAVNLPNGFHDEVLDFEGLEGAGLREPTMIRFAPDGRVFIAQKGGKILVYDGLGDPTPTLFADLSEQAYDNGDRGLLSIAIDPEFPARPYVYALYTYNHELGHATPAPAWENADGSTEGDPCPNEGANADCPVSGRIVRLTAQGDQALPGEKVLVEGWCQQFSSHSVGDLEFGPEGNLFATGGEGASFNDADYGQFGFPQANECGDPPGKVGEPLSKPKARGGALRAQNMALLNGKMIKIDPETGEGVPGNPYYASANPNTRRIIALGFRNPFRFALDPESGQVYVDNVGWASFEEIDRFPFGDDSSAAYNSGWPCYEGPDFQYTYLNVGLDACQELYGKPSSTSPPFASWRHGEPMVPGEEDCPVEYGASVTGIAVDRSASLPPAYRGGLFFADSIRQCIYVMRVGANGEPDPSLLEPFATDAGLYPAVDIEVGPDGDLYYVDLFAPNALGEPYGPGKIHRIAYSASGKQPPVARLTVDKRSGDLPLTVTFSAAGSTDADGEALSYEWDPQNDGSFEAASKAATRAIPFTASENRTVAVRVTDASGAATVARTTVYPGDTPPRPTITSPAAVGGGEEAALHWRVGEGIKFSGGAADTEDGTLAPAQLSWTARLYHCPHGPTGCHVHPLQSFPKVAAGTLIAPDHDYPSHLELVLTAVDSRGLETNETIQIYPRTVDLRFESQPPGMSLAVALESERAPFDLTAIEGANITVSAPETQTLEGRSYAFSGWSDGGASAHSLVANQAASYVATYAEIPPTAEPPREEVPGSAQPPATGATPPASAPPPVKPAPRAPTVSLTAHPAKHSKLGTARFEFTAEVGGADDPAARFECRLDKGAFHSCRSGRLYRRLEPGDHVLRVRAVAAGLVGRATVFRWTVEAPD